ncbi:hypothetical protein HHI36_011770, partial [Cryptolaemus montrouzieri]
MRLGNDNLEYSYMNYVNLNEKRRLKDKYKSHLEKSIRKRDLQMLNSDDNKSEAIWN